MPAMSARPAEPMGFFGQGGQLPFMLTEEQLLHQQQLLREKQEFDAWRASRAQAKTQSQPQALSEAEVNVEINVDSFERSASVARARPQDQVTKQAKAKRAGSASTSRRSPSPKRDSFRGTCTVTRPSQASPRKAEHTVAPAQDLEAFKADMTSMLSDMLQASFQKFASQFNTNSGGQGNNSKEDTVPKQVFSEPTVDVASDDDNENSPHRGPEDQSEGEITEGEADPADSGLPTLEQLKMSKEEQQDYDAFSLASVSVPTRPWRAMGDSRSSQSQPPDNANVSQARPQAIAKAQSIKSSSSDQRSVQHHADQRQVQLRAPQDQANFPVLVPQGQGQRPVLGRPVVRRDLDSLLDEEFSVDLDNEAVLKEKQARSEILDKIVSPVGGRLSNFVEGWKRITNDPYILSIVAKGYRLRFTSPPLLRQIPWEIRSPQDPKEVLGMREQITLMLQKNAITEVPPDSPGFYSNVFLVRKASGGWHPVIDLKNLNAHIHAPHFRMFTTSSVLSSVEKGDYAFKIDLQDAYFHVPIHPSSRKYLRFALENRVYQFRVLPFGLNTAPQVFTRLGHTVTAYLHHQGVSVIPLSGRLVSSPPGPSNFITTSGPANRYARPRRLHSESKEIRAGPYSGSPVPRSSLASGLRESFTPRLQGWGDSRLRAPSILPQGTRLFSSVPSYGFTQLGLRSYPSGSFVPETPSTSFSFVESDKPVYATAQIRPCGPCQPTAALAGPTFSYLRNPDPPLSGGLHDLHGRLQSGLGRSHGRFQGFGFLDPYRPQAPHQLSGAQGGYSRPTALGSSASGPPSHDRHGQFDSGFIYQQAGRDSLPFPATLDCRASPLVRGTRHSSPGETHSRVPEHDSRPPISSESANTDRVVPTPRDRETHLQGLGDTSRDGYCHQKVYCDILR